MKLDNEIEADVEQELKSDPELDATDIAVSVKDGVVTLAGFVKSYSDKLQAEHAAKRVAGVVGLANDLEVRLPAIDEQPDPDIAREAIAAIRGQLPATWESIRVIVKNGWITLEGVVQWYWQRIMAENAVRRLKGVRGVTNSIILKPRVSPVDVKKAIEEAFRRSAEIDADRVLVETTANEIVLRGTVRSWAERREAERAAWSIPGVVKVDNQIKVHP